MKKKSYSYLLFVAVLYLGCLVPGAPHHFFYGHFNTRDGSCDSIMMTSYPSRWTDFLYKSCTKNIDSVFIFDVVDNEYHRMDRYGMGGQKYLYYEKKATGRKKKKIEQSKILKLVKFHNNSSLGDTVILERTNTPMSFR